MEKVTQGARPHAGKDVAHGVRPLLPALDSKAAAVTGRTLANPQHPGNVGGLEPASMRLVLPVIFSRS